MLCGLSSSINFSLVSNWNYLNCTLNYQNLFYTRSRVFCFEHVHFHPFHPGLIRTLSFGEQFFERLHIDFSSLYDKVPPQNTSLSLLQLHFLLALNSDYPRFVGHLFNHRRFGLLAFIAGLPSSPSLFMSPQLADKLSSFYSLDFSFCRSLFPSTEYEVWQSIVSSSSCSHSTVDSPLCFWESSLLLLLQENISSYCGFKLSRYLKCKLPPFLRSYSILCSTLST